eukprot:scaffold4302_cov183-Ochromonas_danica.AAC.5
MSDVWWGSKYTIDTENCINSIYWMPVGTSLAAQGSRAEEVVDDYPLKRCELLELFAKAYPRMMRILLLV